jgi:hypothetical protein
LLVMLLMCENQAPQEQEMVKLWPASPDWAGSGVWHWP